MKLNKTKHANEAKVKTKINVTFWDNYAKNTATLSSICRQLSFGEGGICWFFLKQEQPSNIPLDIKIILTFLVLFFIFDACQYFTLAFYNKIMALFYEEKLDEGVIKDVSEVTRPPWINYPGNLCFILKLFCLGVASFFLIGKLFFQYYQ